MKWYHTHYFWPSFKGTIKLETPGKYVQEIEKFLYYIPLTVLYSFHSTRNFQNKCEYLYQNTVIETILGTKKLWLKLIFEPNSVIETDFSTKFDGKLPIIENMHDHKWKSSKKTIPKTVNDVFGPAFFTFLFLPSLDIEWKSTYTLSCSFTVADLWPL